MGQSASHSSEVTSFEGKTLYELSDDELQVLLTMNPWSKEEILVASRAVDQSGERKVGFYSKEQDSPEAELAVHINRLSKELANLRFSLVPSRLKEPVFWESVFAILNERLDEHNAQYESSMEVDDVDQRTGSSGQSNGHDRARPSPTKVSTSFPDDEEDSASLVSDLKRQLAAKDKQIAALRRQVEEYKALTEATGHRGEWVMDKDSKDFLSYPAEVKENMRKEKQKRLRQVQQDMKFILDSDNVEDSNGHWACCGQTAYRSKCSKAKGHWWRLMY